MTLSTTLLAPSARNATVSGPRAVVCTPAPARSAPRTNHHLYSSAIPARASDPYTPGSRVGPLRLLRAIVATVAAVAAVVPAAAGDLTERTCWVPSRGNRICELSAFDYVAGGGLYKGTLKTPAGTIGEVRIQERGPDGVWQLGTLSSICGSGKKETTCTVTIDTRLVTREVMFMALVRNKTDSPKEAKMWITKY